MEKFLTVVASGAYVCIGGLWIARALKSKENTDPLITGVSGAFGVVFVTMGLKSLINTISQD